MMPANRVFHVGEIKSGDHTPFFILGPCVIESEEFVWKIAEKLQEICRTVGAQWIFKASYDKANRSSSHSFRGIGPESGCRILQKIGSALKVPVTTDVHSVPEAKVAAESIDLLQIPAFLCRQTDLIQAAGASGRAVNVKKGQFLAPWDVANIGEKLEATGCHNYVFTERGVTFGYNNLVADMRSLYWIRKQGYPVVFDATHSVQRPGSAGTSTGGDGELAPVLARSAMAAGCDGIFIETHPNPSEALSDGPNQIPLSELPRLLSQLMKIHEVVR
jgi:2-dehydro-3-deoxyphosphooctonate aldolase (KDO 8-P synthase)